MNVTDYNYIQSTAQMLITSTFNLIATFLIIYLFRIFIDKSTFFSLGFQTSRKSKEIFYGFSLGLIIMLVGFLILLALDEIVFLKTNVDYTELIYTFLIFIIVALVEETLIRGYILSNLMLSFNKYLSLIISSLLFALIHYFNPNIGTLELFNLFLAGLLLGISYIFTKNLWFPIALHFSWNFFQSFFGFNVSGQPIYSLLIIKIPKNNIINGGDFGFEGSILASAIQLILIFFIWKYYYSNYKQPNFQQK